MPAACGAIANSHRPAWAAGSTRAGLFCKARCRECCVGPLQEVIKVCSPERLGQTQDTSSIMNQVRISLECDPSAAVPRQSQAPFSGAQCGATGLASAIESAVWLIAAPGWKDGKWACWPRPKEAVWLPSHPGHPIARRSRPVAADNTSASPGLDPQSASLPLSPA